MNVIIRLCHIINFILMSFWGLCFSPIVRLWTPKLAEEQNHQFVFVVIFFAISLVGLISSVGGSIYMIRKDYPKLVLMAVLTFVNGCAQLSFRKFHVVSDYCIVFVQYLISASRCRRLILTWLAKLSEKVQ